MEITLKDLKNRFISASVLPLHNPMKQCIVETDASDFAIGAVLSHRGTDEMFRLIAYHSQMFSLAEINYEIHHKELLAIMDSFKVWRRYLEGALDPVLVYTDHQNLDYFMTTKIINRLQARWAQDLAGIKFKICYRPGSQNGKPHTLSGHSELRP
jgi:hypothetical protein